MSSRTLTVLHFNDVYIVEPEGDAERFATQVRNFNMLDQQPLTLFSGDCFNPSLLSTITKGKQMVEVLNSLGVHCACVGNHDLDFGVQNMELLISQCSFPWLLANIMDKHTGRPLGGVHSTHLMEWQGIKVGLVGLAEQDWIATLATVNPSDVDYLEFRAEGTRLAALLREQGAEVVIALTHMRLPNDIICAQETDGIDLVLGGHDHDYSMQCLKNRQGQPVHVVKSGTDFRTLSLITMELPGDSTAACNGSSPAWPRTQVERIDIAASLPADPVIAGIARSYADVMGSRMARVVGETATDLDGRFATVRLKESNLGNWITDLWRSAARADMALLNGGTLRSDRIHPAGQLTMKDLLAILPILDPTVVLQLEGATIVAALENGVSQYPKLEGRFLQVSGVKFKFDPCKPPGKRISPKHVWVARDDVCEPLDLSKQYTVATKAYLTSGKDGFGCLMGQKVVVDEENGPLLATMAANVFSALSTLNHFNLAEQRARNALHRMRRSLDNKCHPQILRDGHSYVSIKHPDHGRYVIAPACDGRIVCLQP